MKKYSRKVKRENQNNNWNKMTRVKRKDVIIVMMVELPPRSKIFFIFSMMMFSTSCARRQVGYDKVLVNSHIIQTMILGMRSGLIV